MWPFRRKLSTPKPPTVRFERVHPDAVLPAYMSDGAAGMDLTSVQDALLGPGEKVLVPTGLRIRLPKGYEGQVRPRSGLALQRAITVLNAPGTVDDDYRGEVNVLLYNASKVTVGLPKGSRIAQFVVAPVVRATVEEGVVEDDTARGSDGFGSTGLAG